MIITHASKDITAAILLLQQVKRSLPGNREFFSKMDLAIDCLDDCLDEALAREEEEAKEEARCQEDWEETAMGIKFTGGAPQ